MWTGTGTATSPRTGSGSRIPTPRPAPADWPRKSTRSMWGKSSRWEGSRSTRTCGCSTSSSSPARRRARPADELKKAKDERLKAVLDAHPGHAFIGVNVCLAGWVDQGAAPLAADSLRKAPIVHLNGPLTFELNPGEWDPPPLLADLYGELSVAASIGTPGVGYNTFATLCFDDVPKDIHPVAEIEFPAKDPGGRPVRTTLELTNRSGRNLFYQPVKVPDGVGPGKAKVTISIAGLKKIEVARPGSRPRSSGNGTNPSSSHRGVVQRVLRGYRPAGTRRSRSRPSGGVGQADDVVRVLPVRLGRPSDLHDL